MCTITLPVCASSCACGVGEPFHQRQPARGVFVLVEVGQILARTEMMAMYQSRPCVVLPDAAPASACRWTAASFWK